MNKAHECADGHGWCGVTQTFGPDDEGFNSTETTYCRECEPEHAYVGYLPDGGRFTRGDRVTRVWHDADPEPFWQVNWGDWEI